MICFLEGANFNDILKIEFIMIGITFVIFIDKSFVLIKKCH